MCLVSSLVILKISRADPEKHLHARLVFNPGREVRRSSTLAIGETLVKIFKSEAGAVINVVQLGVRKKSDCSFFFNV